MARIARVVINSAARAVNQIFDYNIPESAGEILPGMRVFVPFGPGDRRMEGYVTGLAAGSEVKELKDILKKIDEAPVLTENEISDAFWLRERYLCTYAEALKLFLPPGGGALKQWICLNPAADLEKLCAGLSRAPLQRKIVKTLSENEGRMEAGALKRATGPNISEQIKALSELGALSVSYKRGAGTREKTHRHIRLTGAEPPAGFGKKAPAQARAFAALLEYGPMKVSDLYAISRAASATVSALAGRGLAEFYDIEVLRSPTAHRGIKPDAPPTLTKEQEQAVGAIMEGAGGFLIHGITGSGKTEVYLKVIEDALKRGEGAIVLVPEIALTPQMSGWFIARFGEGVALLHSRISPGERFDEWQRIRRGEARVVVGARSAVFAPVKNLGVIVVDEEHELTYKSEISPRYHAREVAERRAQSAGAKLILASATPSVESYYRALRGELRLIEMKNRCKGGKLPDSELVDMRAELAAGNRSILSGRLKEMLEENISRGRQSILFLNRRGFSTFVSCRSCGFVYTCPNCSISLKYHKYGAAMTCHYCGYRAPVHSKCPSCQSSYIKHFGTGTQKAEELIKNELPAATVIRMDVDTTTAARSHERILERFEKEGIDILLGTQMVAKGLDFPNVTLVGVLAADMSLNALDFRAAERTFSLITQVSGRAGRGDERGRVVIQTYMPENFTLRLALSQDYKSFYKEEINVRKALNFPPFCDIINIMLTGEDEGAVSAAARAMEAAARREIAASGIGAQVFKAMPGAISRLRGQYRWHFWIKCDLQSPIYEIMGRLADMSAKGVSVVFDVNPIAF